MPGSAPMDEKASSTDDKTQNIMMPGLKAGVEA